jgi:hypothetical protein
MTLCVSNIQRIEQQGKYLTLAFNKKYLINNSTISRLVSGELDDESMGDHLKDTQDQWTFKCKDLQQAEMFLQQVMHYKHNPAIKPQLSNIICSYR